MWNLNIFHRKKKERINVAIDDMTIIVDFFTLWKGEEFDTTAQNRGGRNVGALKKEGVG